MAGEKTLGLFPGPSGKGVDQVFPQNGIPGLAQKFLQFAGDPRRGHLTQNQSRLRALLDGHPVLGIRKEDRFGLGGLGPPQPAHRRPTDFLVRIVQRRPQPRQGLRPAESQRLQQLQIPAFLFGILEVTGHLHRLQRGRLRGRRILEKSGKVHGGRIAPTAFPKRGGSGDFFFKGMDRRRGSPPRPRPSQHQGQPAKKRQR